jgi:hypothetical protein
VKTGLVVFLWDSDYRACRLELRHAVVEGRQFTWARTGVQMHAKLMVRNWRVHCARCRWSWLVYVFRSCGHLFAILDDPLWDKAFELDVYKYLFRTKGVKRT